MIIKDISCKGIDFMQEGVEHHITPFKTYATVYISLLVLTIITVALSRIDLGMSFINVIVAMFIASIKAMIVVLWFMHQKYETTLNRVTFALAFVSVFIFFVFIAVDVFTRDFLINTFKN